MSDINHPDTAARDTAEQIMLAAAKNINSEHILDHLNREETSLGARDRMEFAADVFDWIRSATTEIEFPPVCSAQVFYMQDNRMFGPAGWTWCRVIGGDPRDYTPELPHCTDQADAVAKATAWLSRQKRADPAFPAPVVKARVEESA